MNETSASYPRGVRIIPVYYSLEIIQLTYSGAPDYLTYNDRYYNGVSCLDAFSSITNYYVAYINFIPVGNLNARITSFNYERPYDNEIQK